MRFRKDDIVKIGKNTRYHGIASDNPKDIEGRIAEEPDSYSIYVEWDNETCNWYNEEDLKLVRRQQ